MKQISRRTMLKTGIAFGGACIGVNYGYDLLKDPIAKLDESLKKAIEDLPAASISAAIFRNNQIYWANNYGYQDISSRTIMNDDSAWQSIGSISKLIVWTAVMQLVEKGKLDLHRDISDYIGFNFRSPYYPNTKITTHQLLTHSSSLSSRKLMSSPYDMADSFCKDEGDDLEGWVLEFLSPTGAKHVPELVFNNYKPGDYEHVVADPLGVISGYSNMNAVLAAYVVERLSGKKFDVYCDEEIFQPCGMLQTSWPKNKPLEWMTHYEAEHSPRAPIMQLYTKAMIDQGYVSSVNAHAPDGREYIDFSNCDYFSSVYPMGLLGTSLKSFLPFLLAYLNNGEVNGYRLLKPETVKEVFKYQRTDRESDAQIGLGWFRQTDINGDYIWGHAGGGPGILSHAYINPNTGAGVVLFINNFHVDYRLYGKLINALSEIANSTLDNR